MSFQRIRPEFYILFPPSFFLSLLLQTAYFGDTNKVVEFFKHIGLPVEPHYNPADFIRKCIFIRPFHCAVFSFVSCWFAVEQVKGTVEIQERIIASYKEARSDPELAEQILMAVSVGGTTSTSTIYENYLDGLHSNNLETGKKADTMSQKSLKIWGK